MTEAGPPNPSIEAFLMVLRGSLAGLDATRPDHPNRYKLDLACAYLQHAIELLEDIDPDGR